jgi:alpha-amylase
VSEPAGGPRARAVAPAHDVTLVVIVHDHQPIGNFEDVFHSAFRDAYAPFLEFLESHPAVRLALHTSGPLVEWLEAREPRYLDRLRALVARRQVEPWGGAFYEPILPAIPERDRHGQIAAMAEWIERRLGERPRGLWLAERVWEPGLASSLAAAGVEYTAVDDAHFVAAGFEREQLWGHFRTEDQGLALGVFPIHRELRYGIPFGEPDQVVALLARVAAGGPGRMAVLGDDGEKFGVWPGTHARCYDEGWLESFAGALARHPWIRLATPGEAIAGHPSLGLAYLPTASYHEMQEWALPPAMQSRYHAAAAALEPQWGETAHDLLRGGHWRNFQTRYPESNRIHKRMLRASRRLWAAAREDDPQWRAARTHLWRAQCNCPYWHGVFGGLYLPHLRSAVYGELIAAETWGVEGVASELSDFDLDGWNDALIETPRAAAWISARGGRVWGFDDRRARWNWCDTVAPRAEHYHGRLAGAEVGGGEGETIHAALRLKEPGLAERVARQDGHDRDAFLDRWSEAGRDTDLSGERATLALEAGVLVARLAEGEAPAVEKRFRLSEDGALEAAYTLAAARARRGHLVVEINAAIHVADARDRWIEVNGQRTEPSAPGASMQHSGVCRVAFVDEWAGRRLEVHADRPASLERVPIETVSLSEGGAERVFQGVEARFRFAVELEPEVPWHVTFVLRPESRAKA